MLLIDNINILKYKNQNTLGRLKLVEQKTNPIFIKTEETKRGNKTLFIENQEKKTYIHSKYNPIREAEFIIEEYKEIKKDTTVIFYGTGLGYHIDLFLQKYPNVDYYIYEPIPELLYTYLSNNSIENLPGKKLKNVTLNNSSDETINLLNNIIDKKKGEVLLVELPIHKKIFPKEYSDFTNSFKTILKNKKSNIRTSYAFQKRWIINSMKNFGEVLDTPNILLEKKGKFKDKPAILVAAGPSLNEEIENIRYIKDKGLAYIFSVGSAINTLIHNDIYPDAASTYDPTEKNQIVFEKVKEKKIKEIPMIFGSSVGYETLYDYSGSKYHMITSQDTISKYYLKNNTSIGIVQDAPSIAVVTLQLLNELGFSPIILAGQNLAYKDKKRHSEGVHYSSKVTDEEVKKGIWTKDVNGNEVLTNEGFNRMRQQMEDYIKELPNMEVVNTTKKGAYIEGSTFIELKEVIQNSLKEPVVEKNWLEGNQFNYDIEYLKLQSENMDKAHRKAINLIDEYYDILNKIDRYINNRNFNQSEKMYVKLDKILRKIEKNDFFITFILPMNRVHYKMLADSIDNLNEETNPLEKGKKIIDSFKKFIDTCKSRVIEMEPIYDEMKEKINSFCKQEE